MVGQTLQQLRSDPMDVTTKPPLPRRWMLSLERDVGADSESGWEPSEGPPKNFYNLPNSHLKLRPYPNGMTKPRVNLWQLMKNR